MIESCRICSLRGSWFWSLRGFLLCAGARLIFTNNQVWSCLNPNKYSSRVCNVAKTEGTRSEHLYLERGEWRPNFVKWNIRRVPSVESGKFLAKRPGKILIHVTCMAYLAVNANRRRKYASTLCNHQRPKRNINNGKPGWGSSEKGNRPGTSRWSEWFGVQLVKSPSKGIKHGNDLFLWRKSPQPTQCRITSYAFLLWNSEQKMVGLKTFSILYRCLIHHRANFAM